MEDLQRSLDEASELLKKNTALLERDLAIHEAKVVEAKERFDAFERRNAVHDAFVRAYGFLLGPGDHHFAHANSHRFLELVDEGRIKLEWGEGTSLTSATIGTRKVVASLEQSALEVAVSVYLCMHTT